MKQTPKTIQIFLPGGDPQGIRVAEITTRIVQVIEVPRLLLADFLSMPESDQVALYILFGESEEDEPTVYVGQTSDMKTRLRTHNREKDFWERALIVISRTNSLTQTHAIFLEWHSLNECRQSGRYRDENGNSGSQPHTPAPLKADCLEIYDTAKTLLSTLGYPLFDPVARVTVSPNVIEQRTDDTHVESPVFYCDKEGVNGKGLYTSEGFVVLKGSVGRLENMKSLNGHAYEGLKSELIRSGDCKPDGDQVIFQRDRLFSSPSAAAVAILGRPANGWKDWKTQDDQTLHKLFRETSEN